MSWPSREYSYPLPLRYSLRGPDGAGVVVTLHGYQDTAKAMLRRIGWLDREFPFRVLAVQAPFPVPVWTKDEFKDAFSWYFRDSARGITVLSPEISAERLARLFEDIGLGETPKVLLGFSQGGFLAPYVAEHSKAVKGMIGLACGYNGDVYSRLKPLRIEAIHGDEDERIEIYRARREHHAALEQGHSGQFHLLPGMKHRTGPQAGDLAESLAVDMLMTRGTP